MRTLAAAAAGSVSLVLGWETFGAPDPASTVLAFPLISIGLALCGIALGAAGVAIRRVRRGEPLSPLGAEPCGPAPLPRAIVHHRR